MYWWRNQVINIDTSKVLQNLIGWFNNAVMQCVYDGRASRTNLQVHCEVQNFNEQCSHHIETSHLICRSNQSTDF